MFRPAAFVGALLLFLAWDVALAGQIAQLRRAPAAFRLVSGLCGFLVAPALLVWIGAQSALTGRALVGLAWLWPLVLALCALQSAYVLAHRLATPLVAAPLFVLNAALAFAAAVRYAVSLGYDVRWELLAVGAAQANVVALALGPSAVASPLAVLVPILAPTYPARSRVAVAVRSLLAVLALGLAAAVGEEWPAARSGLEAYRAFDDERVTERAQGRFVAGLRILHELTGAPGAIELREDLDLADSLRVGALQVRVTPSGCTSAALDSLERVLEPYRRDSTLLMVALAYPRDAALQWRLSSALYLEQRVAEVERIVRRLRPDYLVPADAPYGAGAEALGVLSVQWWKEFFTATASAAHRLRPATKVALTASAAGPRDSALFEWGAASGSPVDVIEFAIVPGSGGARRVSAALATADRWMRRAGTAREHWLVASAAPAVEGEDSQRRFVRHVIAWAVVRPYVRGVVLADASDYDRVTGFRTAGGRLRPATADAAAAIRTLVESPTQIFP